MKSVGEVEVPQPVGVVKSLKGDPIGEQRMESIKEKFDEFLQGMFKEGGLVEVTFKDICGQNRVEKLTERSKS